MSYQHRVECEQLRHKLNVALQRAEAAEEKLAELEKQEPTGLLAINTGDRWRIADEAEYIFASEHGFAASELFTRPAPAINLAELVPPEAAHHCDPRNRNEFYHEIECDAWNACRAAILRKIEEEK